MKLKSEENLSPKGIRTCDTGALLCQLKVIVSEEYKRIYERSYIWTAEDDMKTDWSSRLYTQLFSSCEIKAYVHLYSSLSTGDELNIKDLPLFYEWELQ